MKKVVEGYCCVSALMGISIHPENKNIVSVRSDIFTKEMVAFKDKKVRITIEELEE